MDRLATIKAAAQKVKEESQFKAALQKKSKKIKKNATAGKKSESHLDAFHEKNMYMSEKEVYNTIKGSGILDTYNAMKEYDAWQ